METSVEGHSRRQESNAKILRQELAWYIQGISKEDSVAGERNPPGREQQAMRLEDRKEKGEIISGSVGRCQDFAFSFE